MVVLNLMYGLVLIRAALNAYTVSIKTIKEDKMITFKSFFTALSYASIVTNATNTKWTHSPPHHSSRSLEEMKSREYQIKKALNQFHANY